jgi:glycosyltransferase involved in cell wall biosynthesis
MGAKIFYFVDHTANFAGNSGIQRVTRYLGRAFVELGRDVVFVSWDGEKRAARQANDDELQRLARWNGPAFRPQDATGRPLELDPAGRDDLAASWLIVPECPHHGRPDGDVTRDLVDYAHRIGLKIAFIFYDLVPLKMRGYEELRERHARYLHQAALADMLLPISRYAGDTLERYYKSLRFPAAELPQIIRCPLPEEVPGRTRVATPSEPTGFTIKIISLGVLEPRKNHERLLRAFNAVCDRRPDLDLRLTLIGNHYPAMLRRLEKLMRRNPRIEFARTLPDEDVFARYGDCHFTVFPSLEEGYGLPIVESLWFGKPCLCANFGAMAEAAAGGGCLTIDTRSVAELARGIETLASDAALGRRLAQEAATRPMRSWRDYAGTVLGALDRHTGIRQAYFWVDFTVQHPFNTGVQRVPRGLARSLESLGVELEYVWWDHRAGKLAPINDAQRRHLAKWNGPAYRPARPLSEDYAGKWLIIPEILTPPEPAAADVIRFARARGMKTAFLFYDLIPLKLSAMFPRAFVDAFVNCWKMMRDGDVILPISRAAGNDLRGFYAQGGGDGGAPVNAAILPCPLPGEFIATPRSREPRARDGRAASLLCVGTIDPRKNQLPLVEALARLRRDGEADGISLAIAGSSKAFPEYAAEVAQRIRDLPNVTFVDHVDDAALQELYARCDFTVYASYEEGFGLPVMESLWNARPCLCHNAGAIAEAAAEGGCLMVDMRDADALRAGILRLARDHDLYRRLAQEAVSRPIKTWNEYAVEVAGILAQRMGRPMPRVQKLAAAGPPSLLARLAQPAAIYAGLRRRARELSFFRGG